MTHPRAASGRLTSWWRRHAPGRRLQDPGGPPRTGGHVTASMHESGVVLFNARRGRFYSSNAVGAFIWQGLEQGRSADTIARGISDQYRIPVETVRADVLEFVRSLERERLVTGGRGR